ncbi:sulfatase [Paenibacillus swuensis]|uniref:Sulfatase n=1 Tax=Paenibacillus swuensis TaxID=1178515 RepID=A0A172TEQ6_9BACL|nr:LTA synthase family protein [Paenibacillus swuensis]ANE45490.1 sulfatase [Paenibacillus swuensis]
MQIGSKRERIFPSQVFFVCLFVKIIVFRILVFGNVTAAGLFPDVLFVLTLVSLVEMLSVPRFRKTVYALLNLAISGLLFAAVIYHHYFGTVPTYTVFMELESWNQLQSTLGPRLRPVQFVFFVDLLIAGILGLFRMIRNRERIWNKPYSLSFGYPSSSARRKRALWAGMFCVGLALTGVYAMHEIRQWNDPGRAAKLGLVQYQFVAVTGQAREQERLNAETRLVTENQAARLQSSYPYKRAASSSVDYRPAAFGAAKNMNVIMVQLESFQNFTVQARLNGQEITPNLNRLMKDSYYFPYFFTQIGRGNTSDAEFTVNTSMYPTGKVAMSEGYGAKQLPSLPRLLGKHGYASATFHINNVEYWSRNQLYPALGFDRFYDSRYFTNDHFNKFGASDEELYRVSLDKLSDMAAAKKPFYAHFIATSSHAPFVIPKKSRKLKIPQKAAGTQLGDYLTSIHYADAALGKFIEGLKKTGVWDSTLVVVYGDHFGLKPQKTDPQEIQQLLGFPYDEKVSRFNVPLFIHVPGQSEGQGKVMKQTGGQVDLLPTIANLLGISLQAEKFTAFGQDLMNVDRNVLGVRYYLPTGSFMNNEVLFVPGKGFEDGSATSLRTLKPVQVNEALRRDYDHIMALIKLSDRYVGTLPERSFERE